MNDKIKVIDSCKSDCSLITVALVEGALDSSKSRVGGAPDSSKSSHVNQCHWKHKIEKKNSKPTETERR